MIEILRAWSFGVLMGKYLKIQKDKDFFFYREQNEMNGAQGALLAVTHTHTMMSITKRGLHSITPNGDYTTKPHPQHMLERVQSLG